MATEYVPATPHPALRGWVRGYVGYREHSTRPVRRRQAPHGSCPLILGFGPALRLQGPAGPTVASAFVAGLQHGPVLTEFVGEQQGVQVDLSPLGVHALLARPGVELTDGAVPVDALDLPALAALPHRLARAPDWPGRFALVDAVLGTLLATSPTRPDREVEHAWRRLRRAAGTVSIGTLAAEVGWDRHRLATRFRTQIGLGPKTAGRVLRFERAERLLVPRPDGSGTAPRGIDLATVAAVCGFADQAHLTREFRVLSGRPPARYRTEWAAVHPDAVATNPAP